MPVEKIAWARHFQFDGKDTQTVLLGAVGNERRYWRPKGNYIGFYPNCFLMGSGGLVAVVAVRENYLMRSK